MIINLLQPSKIVCFEERTEATLLQVNSMPHSLLYFSSVLQMKKASVVKHAEKCCMILLLKTLIKVPRSLAVRT